MSRLQLAPLFARRSLADMPPSGACLLAALRMTVLARRREMDPLPVLAERLGCDRAARQASHIISIVGYIWPERFAVSPPCCGLLSHDEALLGALTGEAGHGDRAAFDRAARDLLCEDARDQLWRELRAWV